MTQAPPSPAAARSKLKRDAGKGSPIGISSTPASFLPEANRRASGLSSMAVPVAPSASAHPSLQGGSALLKIFGGDGLFFPFLFSEFYESVKRVDFVFEILDNEFDHDGIVEISEAGYTVGNKVIWVRKIRECIQDSLSIFALEPPVLVPEHGDELCELRDATSDELGSVGFFDFFEQAFGFSEDDILVLGITALANLLENLPEVAEVFVAQFKGDLHHAFSLTKIGTVVRLKDGRWGGGRQIERGMPVDGGAS
jgi:hypothetical protein